MNSYTSLCYVSSLLLLGGPVASHAATIEEVFSVNTSSLLNRSGAVDLEFNPGPVSSTQSATAAVSLFTGAAIESGNRAYSGEVSGSLPGVLTFTNGAQLNDAFTPVKFGSLLSFALTLSGPAVSNPDPNSTNGSVFELAFFSTDGTTPLMTSDGIIATVDLAPGTAVVTPTTFASGVLVEPAANVTPEPATFLQVYGALLLLFSLRKLHRHTSKLP